MASAEARWSPKTFMVGMPSESFAFCMPPTTVFPRPFAVPTGSVNVESMSEPYCLALGPRFSHACDPTSPRLMLAGSGSASASARARLALAMRTII